MLESIELTAVINRLPPSPVIVNQRIKPPTNQSSAGVELRVSSRIESRQNRHYFIGEKSVGRMYVESIFSTSLSACSDLITS
jgi:hypothetical protein